MNKKITLLSSITILFYYSCKFETVYDEESRWFLNNEQSINYELQKRIVEIKSNSENDSNWLEKSIVVTRYDTTILGNFANRVYTINECCEIEYTFFKNSNEKKVLTILEDTSDNCKNKSKKEFLNIDSSINFNIRRRVMSE